MRHIFYYFIIFTFFLEASTINFKSGWNFKGFKNSLQISKNYTFNNTDNTYIIWTYSNNINETIWKAYSPIKIVSDKLTELHFKKIETIENYQGIWLYANKNFEYEQLEINDLVDTLESKYNTGWNLLSSLDGSVIIPSELKYALKVFVFRNGIWHVYSSDGSKIPKGLKQLEIIEPDEAYWMYTKSNSLDNRYKTNAINPPVLVPTFELKTF